MEKIKSRKENVIDVQDWDKLVVKTYGKPYKFQQQGGCQDRGNFYLTIPSNDEFLESEEDMHDFIPENLSGTSGPMGVKFNVWLARDPKQPVNGKDGFSIGLFWCRNFYPCIQTLANDLHKKGLIDDGEYTIRIDW